MIGIVDGNENQTGFDLDTWGKLMKIQAADELNFISGTTVMIITMVIIIMFWNLEIIQNLERQNHFDA